MQDEPNPVIWPTPLYAADCPLAFTSGSLGAAAGSPPVDVGMGSAPAVAVPVGSTAVAAASLVVAAVDPLNRVIAMVLVGTGVVMTADGNTVASVSAELDPAVASGPLLVEAGVDVGGVVELGLAVAAVVVAGVRGSAAPDEQATAVVSVVVRTIATRTRSRSRALNRRVRPPTLWNLPSLDRVHHGG